MFRLFPKEENFLPQFNQMCEVIVEAARAIDELAGNFTDAEVKASRIKHLEHRGDQLTHQTFDLLNRTWITSIDREDIHKLISALDDVLDFIDACAQRLILYKVAGPTAELKATTELIVQSALAIQNAVALLADMKHSKAILDACVDINRLENEADTLNRISIGKLFDTVKDPIEIIKWKEIYEIAEGTTDRCEDVANVLEEIVIKST